MSFENTVEKEKLLVTSNFSFFPVFSICLENFLLFSSNLILSSANSFSLDQSKISLFGKGLSLYHIISTFNNSKEEAFENIVWTGENAGNQHFLLLPQCFLPFPIVNFNFWFTFKLSSANAFNLDRSKILLFGKEFRIQQKFNHSRIKSIWRWLIRYLNFPLTEKKTFWEKDKMLFTRLPKMYY